MRMWIRSSTLAIALALAGCGTQASPHSGPRARRRSSTGFDEITFTDGRVRITCPAQPGNA